jgi:GNAT superfamily N-acetyltransferase
MENIHIRTATHNDTSLLTQIIRDSFSDVAERFNLTPENCCKHPSNCTEAWIQNDFNRGVIYYIINRNNTSVGCVALEKAIPDQCYLERLAVLPDERRRGLGHALVNHAFRQARNMGVKEIGIGIISKHKDLKQWYERIGFVEGETKQFDHLPFLVTFMAYLL